jgi:hypothetical protein
MVYVFSWHSCASQLTSSSPVYYYEPQASCHLTRDNINFLWML